MPHGPVIWLVVMEVFDTVSGVEQTLYFSNDAITSGPAASPPNQFFDPRIVTPCKIRRSMFAPGTTFGPSQVGFGDLVLANDDGGLDFLNDFSFDGYRITQYRGVRGGGGKFIKVLSAIMDQTVMTRDEFTVKLKDRQTQVEVAFQPEKYTGGNILPDGLEGVADLVGKPKPILYGRVRNIAPPAVNTQKLIYQISDGPIDSIQAVYDSGIDLSKSPRLWIQESTPISAQIKAIAFGQGSAFASTAKFVAVGFGGEIITSEDGVSWTSRANPFEVTGPNIIADNINWVHFSETQGRWCAVGDGIGAFPVGGIATSDDGITWTQRTSPFAAGTGIFSVVYANTLTSGPIWIIGATSGQIATSPDAENWTIRDTDVTSSAVTSIIFGRGLFIKVLASINEQKLQSSPDGITWTNRNAGVGPEIFLTRGFFGKGGFLVGGRDLSTEGSPDTLMSSFSQDGIAWTPLDQAQGTIIRDISYSEALGKWLITGENEISGVTSQILSSSNAAPPYEVNDPLFFTDIALAIGVSPDITVAGGESGKMARIVAAAELPYTTVEELLDDGLAPSPGTYRAFLDGGYFRLGNPPFGLITVDCTEGAAVENRTAGVLYKNVILQSDLILEDIRQEDLLVLDSIVPDEMGFWSGTNEILSSLILNQIAESAGAWWGVSALGFFRIQVLQNPSIIPLLRFFQPEDMVVFLRRSLIQDEGRGIPPFRTIVRYRRNYTLQTTSLALGVTDARRADLGKQFDDETVINSNIQIDHLLSREQTFTSLVFNQADAAALAFRFQILRGEKRNPFEFSVPYEGNEPLDIGIGVEIIHDRFGLENGLRTVIIGYDPLPEDDTIKLTVWG